MGRPMQSPTSDSNVFATLASSAAISVAEADMLTAVSRTGGLVTPAEALTLYRLCQRLPGQARILEIGSYLGASTTAIGHAILGKESELYCLDCWHDYNSQGFFDHALAGTTSTDYDILGRFLHNTAFLGQTLRVLKGAVAQFSTLLPDGFFDLIFIDGAHDYASVMFDILLGLRVLKPGGLLCGHDFHSDGIGVIQAVNELIADETGIQIKGVVPETSIWYAVVPAQDYVCE